jgi:hypothetical protein
MATFTRRCFVCCLTSCALLAGGCSAVRDSSSSSSTTALPAWPAISGIAEIAPNEFVVVHDSKAGSGEPVLGLVSVGKAASTYAPLAMALQSDPAPNDLESIAALPDSTTIIALESGGSDAPRRAFLLDVSNSRAELLAAPIDIRAVTGAMTNIESLAIETGDAATRRATVLVADRSALDAGDKVDVTVVRIALDFASGRAESLGTACAFTFARPARLGPDKGEWRACTDFVIERDGSLLIAAATDVGDRGPFASLIYRVALAQSPSPSPLPMTEVSRIDGFKVEGIALSRDKKRVWIGTDDEALGGALRPLAPLR